ncbi:MAG: 16S rRNA (guanine(527)-N(7))-methyltransferase RsmG [Pseudomonadota bacterium]
MVLRLGLEELGFIFPEETEQRLLRFLELLAKWNEAYNLTAVRDPVEMVTHHVLDSLAIRPFLKGPRILDVGTGAGLPGIPLAITRPQYQFTLLDSNAKKTRFVTQVKLEMGLDNVEVVTARVEKYRPDRKFDTLVTRAFASLAEMLALSGHLLADDGEFLAMKGAYPQDELEQVTAPFHVAEVCELVVPGLGARRHLVRIVKQSD